VKEAIGGVMKRTGNDCKRYVGDGHFESALPRCELYMKFACQNMTPDQLYPPPNFKLSTKARRKGEWQPKNPMYLNFLRAREKVDPKAPMWKCPSMAIFELDKPAPGPRDEFAKALAQRYPEKELAEAMLAFFDGKAGDARNVLQRVREQHEKAALHATADELRKQITAVEQLYAEGQANLQAEEPERAAEPFREALAIDAQLMKEQAEATQSFFRRNILQDMAAKSYEKGKLFADRQDPRKACRVWKLGFSFYKGNHELLRALGNVCSSRAVHELEGAPGCDELGRIEEFAVDGDGMKERIEERRVQLKCP
jgi:tetratricopeptide (TPR) repeat protein